MWSAFQLTSTLPLDKAERSEMIRAALREVSGGDNATSEDLEIVVHGWYDLSGLRSDADLLVWWHGPTLACVQRAFERLRASDFGRCIDPVWSNVGLSGTTHVGSAHAPAFLAQASDAPYITVYPVVRASGWYQQPDSHQTEALSEWASRVNTDDATRTSIVSGLGLGDYDWIVAIEAQEVTAIMDQIHTIRAGRSSAHLKAETPAFTGRRIDLADWADRQPQSDFDLE